MSEDGAHVIILGCTGMAGMATVLAVGLEEQGTKDVPVIDPTALAVKMAEAETDVRLFHSRTTHPFASATTVRGYQSEVRREPSLDS